MSTTTTYGSWNNHGDSYALTVEATVENSLNGAPFEWVERLTESGALATIVSEYRDEIEAALPPSVSLCGNEFIGPACVKDRDWEGDLDISGRIEEIDLFAIVERHDPDLV